MYYTEDFLLVNFNFFIEYLKKKRILFSNLNSKMIDLIAKIAPDLKYKSSKLSPLFAFNNTLIAFIIDFINIELLEYNRKDKKVFINKILYFISLNEL